MRPSKKQLLASIAFLFVLAMFLSAPRARAQDVFTPSGKRFGVGAQVGAPTALSAEWVFAPELALDVGVGGLIGWGPSIAVFTDVMWSPMSFYDSAHVTISPALGGGAFVAAAPQRFAPLFPLWDYADPAFVWTGLRAPMGALVALHGVPVGFYAQLVPSAFVYPHVAFDVGAQLGMRFYL